jgi:hypothetical protein
MTDSDAVRAQVQAADRAAYAVVEATGTAWLPRTIWE